MMEYYPYGDFKSFIKRSRCDGFDYFMWINICDVDPHGVIYVFMNDIDYIIFFKNRKETQYNGK